MHRILKDNYFILAGTSGTGKTTVLESLRQKGFRCFDEAARFVLEEQLAINGPALPSNSPKLFVQSMQDKCKMDFETAASETRSVFFDRGMPDLVHYAYRFHIETLEFEETSKNYRYNQKVFLFPPWKEIFANDHVRKMTFEKSIEFHELLTKVYQDFGYDLITVPFGDVESRIEFILREVKS